MSDSAGTGQLLHSGGDFVVDCGTGILGGRD